MHKVLIILVTLVLMGAGCVTTSQLDLANNRITDLENKVFDLRVKSIMMHLTVNEILSSQLVEIANQYNLNRFTDCETIKMRLSGVAVAYDNLDGENGTALADEFKGLKEVNKKDKNLVKDLDYIEFCLSQPVADTKN